VDWAVLESASPGFQPGAKPSQLPVQQKKPDVLVTPGFWYSSLEGYGLMSRAQWIEGEHIRRMTGDRPFPSSLFATQPF
jgi:hypothetical protein